MTDLHNINSGLMVTYKKKREGTTVKIYKIVGKENAASSFDDYERKNRSEEEKSRKGVYSTWAAVVLPPRRMPTAS